MSTTRGGRHDVGQFGEPGVHRQRSASNRLFGPLPDVRPRPGTRRAHPKRVGFFTDTSVCIGCKACEVACKEWNTLPMDDAHGTRDAIGLSGMSYDNTGMLGANTWRHVAFIEQSRPVDLPMPGVGLPGAHAAETPDRAGRPRRSPTAWRLAQTSVLNAEALTRVRPADGADRATGRSAG